jgi:hypothetical protein
LGLGPPHVVEPHRRTCSYRDPQFNDFVIPSPQRAQLFIPAAPPHVGEPRSVAAIDAATVSSPVRSIPVPSESPSLLPRTSLSPSIHLLSEPSTDLTGEELPAAAAEQHCRAPSPVPLQPRFRPPSDPW